MAPRRALFYVPSSVIRRRGWSDCPRVLARPEPAAISPLTSRRPAGHRARRGVAHRRRENSSASAAPVDAPLGTDATEELVCLPRSRRRRRPSAGRGDSSRTSIAPRLLDASERRSPGSNKLRDRSGACRDRRPISRTTTGESRSRSGGIEVLQRRPPGDASREEATERLGAARSPRRSREDAPRDPALQVAQRCLAAPERTTAMLREVPCLQRSVSWRRPRSNADRRGE